MKYILFFFCSLLIFTSCASQQNTITRKEARLQLRKQKHCEKAQRSYELASYKYGCGFAFSDTSTNFNTVEIIRDTTIFIPIPGEIRYDSILIPSTTILNTKVSFLETAYAISKAWIENNLLMHVLEQKKSSIPTLIPGALHDNTTIIIKKISVPYPVEKRIKVPLNWFQITFMISGGVFWLCVLLVLAIKIRRFLKIPF